MVELMEFIFSSFWTWSGTVILIISVSSILATGIDRIKRK